MAEHPTTETMPAREQAAFKAAYAAFRAAADPNDEKTARRCASVIASAVDAGWSQRTIAEALGITRERVARLAAMDVPRIHVDPRVRGAAFPSRTVAAYRKAEDEMNLRRILTERTFAGAVRAANAAGWSNPRLGAIVGLTGERMRQIAEMDLSTDGAAIPCFTPYTKPSRAADRPSRPELGEEEAAHMRRLADAARKATKRVGKRLGPAPSDEEIRELEAALAARKASEELSEMLMAARSRGIPWAALDAACGYARGSAQARAVRHGYGDTWASLSTYTPTDDSARQKLAAARGGGLG